ncbi:hypothetical protein LTR95_009107 [Oleoguttula sp. CCFEE 5521]
MLEATINGPFPTRLLDADVDDPGPPLAPLVTIAAVPLATAASPPVAEPAAAAVHEPPALAVAVHTLLTLAASSPALRQPAVAPLPAWHFPGVPLEVAFAAPRNGDGLR